MKKHIIIDNTWPDGKPEVGEQYLKIMPSGGKQKQPYAGIVATKRKSLFISPTDIALTFPPISVAEINDYAWDASKPLLNRGTAQQILYALKGNREIDVLSEKFNNMLLFLLSEIPSYDVDANTAFKTEIGI